MPSHLYSAINKLINVRIKEEKIDDMFCKVIMKLRNVLLDEEDVVSALNKLFSLIHTYKEYDVDVDVDIYEPVPNESYTKLITKATKMSFKSLTLVISSNFDEVSIGLEPSYLGFQITVTNNGVWFFRPYDVAMVMLNVKEFYEIVDKAYLKYRTDDLKYLRFVMSKLMDILAPLEDKLRAIIEQQTN